MKADYSKRQIKCEDNKPDLAYLEGDKEEDFKRKKKCEYFKKHYNKIMQDPTAKAFYNYRNRIKQRLHRERKTQKSTAKKLSYKSKFSKEYFRQKSYKRRQLLKKADFHFAKNDIFPFQKKLLLNFSSKKVNEIFEKYCKPGRFSLTENLSTFNDKIKLLNDGGDRWKNYRYALLKKNGAFKARCQTIYKYHMFSRCKQLKSEVDDTKNITLPKFKIIQLSSLPNKKVPKWLTENETIPEFLNPEDDCLEEPFEISIKNEEKFRQTINGSFENVHNYSSKKTHLRNESKEQTKSFKRIHCKKDEKERQLKLSLELAQGKVGVTNQNKNFSDKYSKSRCSKNLDLSKKLRSGIYRALHNRKIKLIHQCITLSLKNNWQFDYEEREERKIIASQSPLDVLEANNKCLDPFKDLIAIQLLDISHCCWNCKNLWLKIQALNNLFVELGHDKYLPMETVIGFSLCPSTATSKCLSQKCTKCGKTKFLEEMNTFLQDVPNKSLTWNQYLDSTCLLKVQVYGYLRHLLTHLVEDSCRLARHFFTSRWQMNQLLNAIWNFPSDAALIILTCPKEKKYQNIGIFPAITFYKCPDCPGCKTIQEDCIFISPYVSLDLEAVKSIFARITKHLTRDLRLTLKRQIQFTSGECCFKSYDAYMNVSLSEFDDRVGMPVMRNFLEPEDENSFCSRPADAIQHYLEKRKLINNARVAFHYLHERCSQDEVTEQGQCNHSRRTFFYLRNSAPSFSSNSPVDPPLSSHLSIRSMSCPRVLETRPLTCLCFNCLNNQPCQMMEASWTLCALKSS